MVSTAIAGRGTSETAWRPWLDSQRWPLLGVDEIAQRRAVVLAAHPDDEVLGVGGLLRRLSAAGADIVAVWASDGESSHPGSTVHSRARLAALRRDESLAALNRLGVVVSRCVHLGLPDGRLGECRDALSAALDQVVRDGDVVLSPWRGDGHPDHEVVGEVAAQVAPRLLEYPIWMWHWATPDDERVPWDRMRSTAPVDVAVKRVAIEEFTTQIHPLGPDPADAPVLPSYVLDRFLRPAEMVFA